MNIKILGGGCGSVFPVKPLGINFCPSRFSIRKKLLYKLPVSAASGGAKMMRLFII